MKNEVKKSEINMGLNVLRIFAMCGIIGLHVINQGGIIKNISVGSYQYIFVLLLLIIFYTSVDTFGILSGYLNVNKEKNKNSRIIELISIVCFYCLAITFVFYAFNLYNVRGLGIKELVINIFPILIGRYWYITCYVFLFFMIPYINKFVKSLSQKQFEKFINLLCLLLCLLPNVFGLTDFFKIDNGYSPFWLIFCYFIGAYIRLYPKEVSTKKILFQLLICLFLSLTLNFSIRYITEHMLGHVARGDWFINYISPFNIIMSIDLLLLLKNLKTNKLFKFVNFLSKASFPVYIIHSQKLIFDYVIDGLFAFVINYNAIVIIAIVIGAILGIYLLCTLIDEIRILIFKIFRINLLIDKIGEKIDSLL